MTPTWGCHAASADSFSPSRSNAAARKYRPELIDVESRALLRESNPREIALSIGARDIFSRNIGSANRLGTVKSECSNIQRDV